MVTLRTELQQANAHYLDLEHQCDQSRNSSAEAIAAYQHEIDRINEHNSALEANNAILQAQVDQLFEEASAFQDRHSGKDCQAQTEELIQELAATREELLLVNASVVDLKSNSHNELHAANARWEAEINALKAQHGNVVNELTAHHETARASFSAVQFERDQLLKIQAEADIRLAGLVQELAVARAVASKSSQRAQEECTVLKEQLEASASALTIALRDNSDLVQRCSDAEIQMAALRDQIANITADNERKSVLLEERQRIIQCKEAAELDRCNQDEALKSLQQDLDDARSAVVALESERQALIDAVSEKAHSIATLQAQSSACNAQQSKLPLLLRDLQSLRNMLLELRSSAKSQAS